MVIPISSQKLKSQFRFSAGKEGTESRKPKHPARATISLKLSEK